MVDGKNISSLSSKKQSRAEQSFQGWVDRPQVFNTRDAEIEPHGGVRDPQGVQLLHAGRKKIVSIHEDGQHCNTGKQHALIKLSSF